MQLHHDIGMEGFALSALIIKFLEENDFGDKTGNDDDSLFNPSQSGWGDKVLTNPFRDGFLVLVPTRSFLFGRCEAVEQGFFVLNHF